MLGKKFLSRIQAGGEGGLFRPWDRVWVGFLLPGAEGADPPVILAICLYLLPRKSTPWSDHAH